MKANVVLIKIWWHYR